MEVVDITFDETELNEKEEKSEEQSEQETKQQMVVDEEEEDEKEETNNKKRAVDSDKEEDDEEESDSEEETKKPNNKEEPESKKGSKETEKRAKTERSIQDMIDELQTLSKRADIEQLVEQIKTRIETEEKKMNEDYNRKKMRMETEYRRRSNTFSYQKRDAERTASHRKEKVVNERMDAEMTPEMKKESATQFTERIARVDEWVQDEMSKCSNCNVSSNAFRPRGARPRWRNEARDNALCVNCIGEHLPDKVETIKRSLREYLVADDMERHLDNATWKKTRLTLAKNCHRFEKGKHSKAKTQIFEMKPIEFGTRETLWGSETDAFDPRVRLCANCKDCHLAEFAKEYQDKVYEGHARNGLRVARRF